MAEPRSDLGKHSYQILWNRFSGKYVASSLSRPGLTIIDSDPLKALHDLQVVLRLLR